MRTVRLAHSVVCLVLLVMPSVATAQFRADETPLPFGLRLAYDQPANPMPQPKPAPKLGGLSDFVQAQEQIAQLEAERGPYAPDLAAMLIEAAALARSLGLTDSAAELYAWALHNTRVNQGLGTDTQLPIVETLLELHRAQGDVDAMNDREAYLYRLKGSGRPPYDDSKLSAAIRYLDWRISLLEEEDWQGRGRASMNLYEDADDLTEAICADPEQADRWCAAFALRQLGVLYAIDYHLNSPEGDELRLNMRTMRTPDQMLADERLIQLERSAYRAGVRVIEDALVYLPEDEVLQLALADWRWFQGRRGLARKVYKSLAATRPEWFKEAVPLPLFPSIARDPAVTEEPTSVTVTMRITDIGRVRDVTIANESQLSDGVRIRTSRAMRDVRFRPALDDQGETIESTVTLDLISMR